MSLEDGLNNFFGAICFQLSREIYLRAKMTWMLKQPSTGGQVERPFLATFRSEFRRNIPQQSWKRKNYCQILRNGLVIYFYDYRIQTIRIFTTFLLSSE